MKKILVSLIIISSLFIKEAEAQEELAANTWSCVTRDAENRQWIVQSNFGITAMHKSFDNCKKESRVPATCKVVGESCDALLKEIQIQPQFQCTALDFLANTWPGKANTDQDGAVFSAKASCHRNSPVPESCYVNQVTCITLVASE